MFTSSFSRCRPIWTILRRFHLAHYTCKMLRWTFQPFLRFIDCVGQKSRNAHIVGYWEKWIVTIIECTSCLASLKWVQLNWQQIWTFETVVLYVELDNPQLLDILDLHNFHFVVLGWGRWGMNWTFVCIHFFLFFAKWIKWKWFWNSFSSRPFVFFNHFAENKLAPQEKKHQTFF